MSAEAIHPLAEHQGADAAWEETWQAQEELLAYFAHEFRNPLMPIQSAVELIRLPTTTDPQKQRALEIIETQVLELRDTLEMLLDASKVVRGKIELEKQPIRLDDAVRQAVATCRPIIERHGHQLRVTFPAEPVWVMADAARLVRIAAGLLHHASKSCSVGGAIRLWNAVEEETAVLGIEFDSRGPHAEELPRLVELLFQPKPSRQKTRAGTDIGLAVLRQLVELHDGNVSVQMHGPEHGIRYLVRLPRLPETHSDEAVASSKSTDAILGLPPLKILMVTEDTKIANDWCVLLRVAGHEARPAHSGQEMLAMTREFRPQVVCLDMDSKEFDVPDLIRRLREKPGLEESLVFAMTGTKDEAQCRAALAAGCISVLCKPVKVRDFLQLLVANAARLPAALGSVD